MGNSSANQKSRSTDSKGETMQSLNRRTGCQGQGLVEYILVVFLMAIVSITVVKKLSTSTQKGFTTASSKLDKEFAK